jgi:hypothetical protein
MSLDRFLAKLRHWGKPWLAGSEPVELHRAILEEVESQVVAVGGGRKVFPFDRVEVKLLAATPAERGRLEAVAQEGWDLEREIRERLKARGVRVPERLEVPLQVTDVDGPEFGGRRYAVAFSRSAAPGSGAAAPAVGAATVAVPVATGAGAGAAGRAAGSTTGVPAGAAGALAVDAGTAGAAGAFGAVTAPLPGTGGAPLASNIAGMSGTEEVSGIEGVPGQPAAAAGAGDEGRGAGGAGGAGAPGAGVAASGALGVAGEPAVAGGARPAAQEGGERGDPRSGFAELPTAKLARPAEAAPWPALRLSVLKGKAVREVYAFAADRIQLGRLEEVLDHTGRVRRRNDVAFLEEGDVNETVSREHARITWDAASRAYWLRDEGSASGTIIFRAGRPIEVSRHDRRGVRLQSGDELYLGRAALLLEIEGAPPR